MRCRVDHRNMVLGEFELRKGLSSTYAAMVRSTQNTELFLRSEPANVQYEDVGGDPRTKSAMVDSCQWLEDVRLQCREHAFDAVFGCVRMSAHYLKSVRGTKSTTSVIGWVFQKSGEIKDAYGQRVAVAMVVPELESCMSLRLDASTSIEVKGTYRVGSVTPIVLVNRLHPIRPDISPFGGSPDLGAFDFLKVSLGDAGTFTESVEMDRYCEVASVQSQQAHHLGAPMILAGTLVDADDIRATIRGWGKDTITVAHSAAGREYESLQRMKGAPGRFLVVWWYQPGDYKKGSKKQPEMYHFEEAGPHEVRHDDLIGYVRLRGKVDASALEDMYGTPIPDAPCLAKDGTAFVYVGGPRGSDPVINSFLDTMSEIKRTWAEYRRGDHLQVRESDIVSEEMASMTAVSAWLESKPGLKNSLADALARFDYSGDMPDEPDGSKDAASTRYARSLVRRGLLEIEGGKMSVTDTGRRVLDRLLKDEMVQYLSEKNYVYFPEVVGSIPRSIMLKYLKNSTDFIEHKALSGKNKLLWTRHGACTDAKITECSEKTDRLHKDILGCLRTVNHTVNAKFVHEELRHKGHMADYTSVNIMMHQLATSGKLERQKNDWTYPLHHRIPDIISSDKKGTWDMTRIMNESRIALSEKEAARLQVMKMETSGMIVKVSDGKWAWKTSDDDQQQDYAESIIREKMLALLRTKKRGTDSSILLGRMNKVVLDEFGDIHTDRAKLVRDAIQELKRRGLINEEDGIYRIANDPR